MGEAEQRAEIRWNMAKNGEEDAVFAGVFDDDAEYLMVAIQNGAPINFKDNHGYTPLHYAAFEARLNAMRVLLQAGAYTEALDDEGHTPLHAIQMKLEPQFPLQSEIDDDERPRFEAAARLLQEHRTEPPPGWTGRENRAGFRCGTMPQFGDERYDRHLQTPERGSWHVPMRCAAETIEWLVSDVAAIRISGLLHRPADLRRQLVRAGIGVTDSGRDRVLGGERNAWVVVFVESGFSNVCHAVGLKRQNGHWQVYDPHLFRAKLHRQAPETAIESVLAKSHAVWSLNLSAPPED